MEQKYKEENRDLHARCDQEGRTNVSLVGSLKDLEAKIRAKEEKIHFIQREIEQGKK
jgi:hypothetical protein